PQQFSRGIYFQFNEMIITSEIKKPLFFAGHSFYKETIEKLLAKADIKINGYRPWDLQVNDDSLFKRVFTQGSLGFGEAYMDKTWDCDQLDELFFRILRAGLEYQLPKSLQALSYVL